MGVELKDKPLLVGGDEFCKEIVAALRSLGIEPGGVAANTRLKEIGGVPVIAPESRLGMLKNSFSQAICALDLRVGARLRRYVFKTLIDIGFETPSVVSPLAEIAPGALLGEAVLILPGARIGESAAIGENVVIGENCAVGDGAVIGADSIVEAGAIVSENAALGDGVQIEKGALVAAGARLGRRSRVVAGASVSGEIPAYKIARF